MEGINNIMDDSGLNITNKAKHRVPIKDAKELMTPIHGIMDLIFDRRTEMSDGLYVALCDKIKVMTEGEFYIELKEIAAKPSRKPMERVKKNNRKMVIQHPDKYVCCDRCNEPLLKKSLANHLKSQSCKDKAYTVKATKDSDTPDEETNGKIVDMYDNNEPLVDIELTAENYFWANMAGMYDAY
tara:strand:- start:14 stop:565 length:552 start_codon:yes stop_codon:yes gene_type:complete